MPLFFRAALFVERGMLYVFLMRLEKKHACFLLEMLQTSVNFPIFNPPGFVSLRTGLSAPLCW